MLGFKEFRNAAITMPVSSYCTASGGDSSDWDVRAFKAKLRQRARWPQAASLDSPCARCPRQSQVGTKKRCPDRTKKRGLDARDGQPSQPSAIVTSRLPIEGGGCPHIGSVSPQ